MISRAKQLASISAAGASAIVLGGAKADAGIVNSGILNYTIGFTDTGYEAGAGDQVHVFNSLAGGPSFAISAHSGRVAANDYTRVAILARGGHATNFGTVASFGATCNCGTKTLFIGDRYFGSKSSARLIGPIAPFADKYAEFKFSGSSFEEYGWIELSASETLSTSGLASDGPTVTVVQYAFDNTGAPITAGEGAATPEPSSLAESGLAALILGAKGLRRWRKARKAV